ncbi:MAG: response regulator transcription factor [Chitinophagales bacterium]|jgi:DNA-binding LytR/AlgR family response regulator|nr:response regulator transcription factor [Bacteroidota bacterium]MBK7568669.1 response regulator transcription factor [Bacteroidota bacterium]MBP8916682.1 response regulator transcription factor [Chitinophagales bacterium]MBP9220787.1 response regulator transcription factor [Chitinophagales bacterium]MBP9794991.1 response regulator transcription factor [Chitinophagales bacterium]
MKIQCIIIEDEPLAMEKLKGFVMKHPDLILKSTFNNGADALVFLQTNNVDLLFLDINLGEMSGIRILETANISANVILTTAYSEFALKGYELNVTDYLLKPFTFERFMQAVNKVVNPLPKRELVDQAFIFIKTEYRLEKVMYNDILYIEGMGDYRRIFTVNKNIMTLQTFKELEEELPKTIICRVHKSYMVGLQKIDSVQKDEIHIGNKIIPVSETYKKEFYDLIR